METRTHLKKRNSIKIKVATTQNIMKNLTTIIVALLFASFILTSCGGSSIESDAKKYAALTCKAQKVAAEGIAKAASGDMSALTESTKLASEAAALGNEMQGKYKNAADLEKFSTAYLKALAECK